MDGPPFPVGFDETGNRQGYAGDGFLDINGGTGPKAFFTVEPADVPTGDYQLTLRGAAFGNRSITIEVNGVAQGPAQNFNTVDWDLWDLRTFDITVPETTDPIVITIVQTGGAGPNIDAVALHDVGAPVSFFAPEITSGAQFDVDDSGTFVGTIDAEDPSDSVGTPSDLTYALSGTDALRFQIDDSGNLSFVDQPDFDAPLGAGGNAYSVTVEVSDGVDTATQDVTVNVSAAADAPTFDPIVILAEEAIVPDDASTVLRAQGGAPEGNTAGKDAFGLWEGYSGTGYYDFNGTGTGLDWVEAITFEVTVTDAGSYDLHIRMMNVASNRPLDIGVNGAVQVPEAAFNGVGFGNGNWVLRDAITLDLVAGTNTVTLAVPAGRTNGPNVDAIAVTATGAPAPMFPSSNTAPMFDQAPTAVEVTENTIKIADFSADDDGLGTVTYALSGPDANLFTISESGSLTFIDAPDFEVPGGLRQDNTYAVRVTVADEASAPLAMGSATPQTVALRELSPVPLKIIPADVEEAVGGGPREILFDGEITSYSTQDGAGTATPSAAGDSLTLSGNLWKRLDIGTPFDVTETSRLFVDIEIGALTPELVLIGFDNDDSPFEAADNSVFNLAGTQTPPDAFVDLRNTGTPQPDGTLRFEIDIGGLAGRSFDSLIVVADDDNGSNGLGSVTFSNVVLSGQASGATENGAPVVVGGGIADVQVGEGESIEVDLPFIDPDDDAMTYAFQIFDQTGATVEVPSLSITDNVLSGGLPDAPGIYTVTVTAEDGKGGIGTDSFVLTVVDVNDAPDLLGGRSNPSPVRSAPRSTASTSRSFRGPSRTGMTIRSS